MEVPYSDLASPELRRSFIARRASAAPDDSVRQSKNEPIDILKIRRDNDEHVNIPEVDALRRVFAVDIKPESMGGVAVDVITPLAGIARRNKNRVLVNLHGGGMVLGSRYAGQIGSIPIASIARIMVITVDYRRSPEWKYPAASEDVTAVFRSLLKRYPAKNIGLYGCSSGGDLAAQSVAWFSHHNTPRPGAIGMFGSGAAILDHFGDANYTSSALMGAAPTHFGDELPPAFQYVNAAQLADPLVE